MCKMMSQKWQNLIYGPKICLARVNGIGAKQQQILRKDLSFHREHIEWKKGNETEIG